MIEFSKSGFPLNPPLYILFFDIKSFGLFVVVFVKIKPSMLLASEINAISLN